MNSPAHALLWLCWQRIKFPVLFLTIAIVVMAVLMIVYFNQGQSERIDLNTILVCAGLGIFILAPMTSNSLAGPGKSPAGTGFPLRAEFAFPLSTTQLNLLPFIFVGAVLYGVFIVTVGLLTSLFSLPMPHPMIQFMVVEYLLIVMAISWAGTNIYETLGCWVGLIVLFYLNWLLPDFSFDSETGEFLAGSWSSLILPCLIIAAAVLAMVVGVRRQRSGEHLLYSAAEPTKNSVYPLAIRPYKTSCPSNSAAAAWAWHQRQFRGKASGAVMGLGIGVAVVLVLLLTDMRGFWNGPLELDDVSGFAFIFFCSVFVAQLAAMFGVSYANGASSISTFERTLPFPTLAIVRERISVALQCLLIAGLLEFITIAILGSLLLEDFQAIRAEFMALLVEFAEHGILYMLVRAVLSLCFVYALSVLWAVFITWFAIKPRPMTIAFATLSIYWLLQLAYLVATTDGSGFLTATQASGRAHSWLIAGIVLFGAFALLPGLTKNQVLRSSQALFLIGIGLLLFAINSFELEFLGGLEADASLAKTVMRHTFGLLPLVATTLALWTQDRLRHG